MSRRLSASWRRCSQQAVVSEILVSVCCFGFCWNFPAFVFVRFSLRSQAYTYPRSLSSCVIFYIRTFPMLSSHANLNRNAPPPQLFFIKRWCQLIWWNWTSQRKKQVLRVRKFFHWNSLPTVPIPPLDSWLYLHTRNLRKRISIFFPSWSLTLTSKPKSIAHANRRSHIGRCGCRAGRQAYSERPAHA